MKPKGGHREGAGRKPKIDKGKPTLLYLYPKQIDFLKSQPNGSALVRNLLDTEQNRQDELARIKKMWRPL